MNVDNKTTLPILYTFIRCPWAMRARLALAYMGIEYECREVDLKNKPQSLLDYSPKGTVPVLILSNGTILEESLDIILWAMSKQDSKIQAEIDALIYINDGVFKANLYRYKYPERYKEEGHTQEYYRTQGESFFEVLDLRLKQHKYLINDEISIADLAIFPLIRQFSKVDETWFVKTKYKNLQRWLAEITNSDFYIKAMKK